MNIPVGNSDFESAQMLYCKKHGYDLILTPHDLKVGLAMSTLGELPINGLRHAPESDTSGWYIWCGEKLLASDDFFSSIHAIHLVDLCLEVVHLLGLPPGYRFLKAGEYVDLWYDSLLKENG